VKILALEFSTPRRSVAVAVDGVVVGTAMEQGTRETHAFALIQEALQGTISRNDIECVAVGTGPGSYAGTRIAIAIAQGWHVARGVKLLAVSSADAVAAQAQERGWRGPLHLMIDAQRKELHCSEYSLTPNGWEITKGFHLMSPSESRPSGHHYVRFDVLEHENEQCLLPEAATIARLASRRADFVTPPELQPIYLRKAEFVKAPPPRIIPQ
jgi:tRNA threonylcarbamoyl adenosine modification protein YeaZ